MMHCTDGQLVALMDNHVVTEDPRDEAKAIAHLEECESCQERLQHLSGEGDWLNELLDSVRKETGEFADTSRAASVVVTTDLSDPFEMDSGIHCESVRLDFLESPRHPELLGRLGRYDIEQMIGMGGFGIVFKARDSELNRVVAIKVLAPHLMSSGPARKRFAREAQASAAVVHDHVVAIYDVVSQADSSYFVMQYVAGESLQQRVDREGTLDTKEVLRIASQMAAGLHAAHEQGLIHRDVKPANAILEDSVDRVLITDFGLARTADDASITRSGVISGTPHYMSPEQSRGEVVDTRSDLFSLGSVIYFMCTGHPPFRAPRMVAVLNRICHEPHRPLVEVNPETPVELSEIVDRLLAKAPADRYDSADRVRHELNELLRDVQSGIVRPRRQAKRIPVSRASWLAGAAIVSLLMVAVIWLGWFRNRTPAPPSDGNAFSGKVVENGAISEELVSDPFAEQLVETQSLVERFESQLATFRLVPFDVISPWTWQSQMVVLDEALTQLEEAMGPWGESVEGEALKSDTTVQPSLPQKVSE